MTKRGMLRQSDSLCAKGIVPDPFPEHIVFSLSANISTPRWHFFCNDRVTNLSLFSLFCKDGETKISFQTCGRCQADLRKLNFDKYVSSRLQAARGRRLFATNGGKWKARNKVSWQLADLANDLGNSSRSELRFCSKYKYNNSYVQIRNLVSANRNSSLKMGSGKNAKKGMFYFLEKLEGGPLLIWLWLLVFCQPAFWVKSIWSIKQVLDQPKSTWSALLDFYKNDHKVTRLDWTLVKDIHAEKAIHWMIHLIGWLMK